MAEVIAVGFDRAEGDAAQAVDFHDELPVRGGGADVDVGFLAAADHVAGGVEGFLLEVRVQGEVVVAAVGEAVSVVLMRGLSMYCR